MKAVGIIANPASGKDIRRLVAYGASCDNQDKVNIVRRILMGLRLARVKKVYYMPDYYGIVPKAAGGMFSDHKKYLSDMEILPIEMNMRGSENDTVVASERMREFNTSCIITIGGDGTNRACAKGCSKVPVVPISTGTNNVFPGVVEGTIAGMAAGAYATGNLRRQNRCVKRSKRLEIYKNDTLFDIALIDMAILDRGYIASRAIWSTDALRQIIVTSCAAHYLGISSIAGQLKEISKSESRGLMVKLDNTKKTLSAPIAPGLPVSVGVDSYKTIKINEKINIEDEVCLIALDGERNLLITKDENVYVKLTWDGPRVLDVNYILQMASKERFFLRVP